jgi:hypothetical protein
MKIIIGNIIGILKLNLIPHLLVPVPLTPPLDARQRPLGAPVRRSGVPCGVWVDPGYNDLIGHPLSRASYLSLLHLVPLVELAH